MLTMGMKLDRRKLAGASLNFKKAATRAVLDTSHRIAEEAERAAPKATGSLGASLYVVGLGEDGYEAAADNVRSLNPKAELFGQLQPEQDAPGESSAYVVSAVFHAAFVEYGTVKHGAQPFFNQAVEKFTDGHLRAAQLALEGVFK